MLQTTQSVWLPDPGGWAPSKDRDNCLWSLSSWVACCCRRPLLWRHTYRHLSALSVFSRHCRVVNVSSVSCSLTLQTQCHCTSFTVLRLSAARSVYFSDTDWSKYHVWRHYFHTQGDRVQPSVRRISCQRSPSPVSSYEIWNPIHCHSVATVTTAKVQSAYCLMHRRTSGSCFVHREL